MKLKSGVKSEVECSALVGETVPDSSPGATTPARGEPSNQKGQRRTGIEEGGLKDRDRDRLDREAMRQSVTVTGLLVLGILYTVYFARDLLIPFTAALFLKLVLSPAVRRFRKWGVPEGIGAAVVVSVTLACGLGVAYQLSGPASEWIERAPRVLEQAERRLATLKESLANVSRAAEQVEQMADVDGVPDRVPLQVRDVNLTGLLVEGTGSFIGRAVATIVLLYLLLASGDLFVRKAISAFRRSKDKARVFGLSRQLEQLMSRYLLTISAVNLGLGVVVGVAMHLLDMPNPFLWGAMVALFNFVPYLGALASLIILTLAAFVTFDDISRALIVGLVFFSVNLVEAYVVTPTLLGYRMRMNPVAIFVTIMFFGWAWGVYGILFAVPILVTVKLFGDHVPSLSPVAHFLGG